MSASAQERETIAHLDRRIVPVLLAAYVVNFLDRVNVGFAALRMNTDLGFGPAVYGLGAGIFFLGYFLFEVPSNLVLVRVGARWWLARIMVTWGLVSAATALVRTPEQFYAARLALGVAEAGFVPALLVYLGQWYPARRRAAAVAKVWSATAIALVVGGPLSAAILRLDGAGGLAGWQWLFVLEALPAVALGVALPLLLTDRPEQADWLPAEGRAWLAAELAREDVAARAAGASHRFADAFRVPAVWELGLLYFFLGLGFFGVTLWLPLIVRRVTGLGDGGTALAASAPFVLAAAAMVLVGRWSDRAGERRLPLLGGCALAALGFGLAAALTGAAALAALTAGAVGLWSVIGVFWQLPAARLTGAAVAAGVAVINTCGSLGGFAGPYLIGWLTADGGGFGTALAGIAAAMLAAAALAAALARRDAAIV